VPGTDLKPLFDAILEYIPAPDVDADAPLQMLIVSLEKSNFVGRIGVGRIMAGKVKKGQRIALLKRDGKRINDTVVQVLVFDRLSRVEVPECAAGDICMLVGLEEVDIGDTVADFDNAVALP